MSDTNLIRKRASIKARLTSFEKYFNKLELEINSSSILDHSIAAERCGELEQRINRINSILKEFDDVQIELECAAEDAEEQYAIREEFETKFYSTCTKAKLLLSKIEQKTKQNISENDSAANSNQSNNQSNQFDQQNNSNDSNTNSNSFNNIKLPTIQLPKFDGSYDVWMEFRDVFESLIHSNKQLNNTSKFQYLRAALEGNAAQVIKSIQVTSENYDLAWNILCERFDNKRLLIQNHVRALFNFENITRESSSKIRVLIDDVSKHLRSLKQLGEQVDAWDTLIIYIVMGKLDNNTNKEWEKQKADLSETPTLQDLKAFLKNRADLLETIESNTQERRYVKKDQARGLVSKNNKSFTYICPICKTDHSIYSCSKFLNLSIKDRISKICELKLCKNCLRGKHLTNECKLSGCRKCSGRHNTLIHDDTPQRANGHTSSGRAPSEETKPSPDLEPPSTSLTVSRPIAMVTKNVLLSTAVVYVRDASGKMHQARALLDSGSQSSFMTEQLAEKLQSHKIETNLCVSGLNNAVSNIRWKWNLTLYSTNNDFNIDISCYVIKQITGFLPDVTLNNKNMNIPANINLADPKFYVPQKIDLLIGSDIFWKLLCVGQICLGPEDPILQKTRFGWIIAGPICCGQNKIYCNFSKGLDVQEQLRAFWEIEEINGKKPRSIEEDLCEKHYIQNVARNPEGRFIVSIPFKDSLEKLGESRDKAIKQFHQLENRLQSNEHLRKLYIEFLKEYELLGHMTIDERQDAENIQYYMPHHGVFKETSLTTKLRVVFNASSPTTTGISLNHLQMTGPTIQDDLFSILLRFRTHSVILSSDIRMMYRQVLIKPEERHLQKIIWRENPNDELRTYNLNTVTYGFKSASFLAIRCIKELANECKETHPEISEIISSDMYVDDLLTGTDTPENAKLICASISKILSSGGFELRKWRSNSPTAISEVCSDTTTKTFEFSANKEQNCKTLGLTWVSDIDKLMYQIKPEKNVSTSILNKRSILSRIAAIFDPLGLLSPSIMKAKVLLQKLWSENLTWDDPLPSFIEQEWCTFESELIYLNDLKISRKVLCDNPVFIELHGFSDASESAYGSCIYLKSINSKNECIIELLCAKSKVAPIKQLTIPRLELCGALTLARLYEKVKNSLRIKIDDVFLWTDSTIVLGWLNTSPNLLKPFVDHRVAEIQKIISPSHWRHVPTRDNPADLVSRGVTSKNLINSRFWFNGPEWLKNNENEWPTLNLQVNVQNLPELKKQKVIALSNTESIFTFERFSNLLKLKRSMAYVLRFINNCRKPKLNRDISSLSVDEVDNALCTLVKIAQKQSFPIDYTRLLEGKALKSDSNILNLNPFLDENQILRVGGRLKNSNFAFNKRHPILISSKHHLTRLIFEFEHKKLLHAGPQLLLAQVRENFWPIAGRNAAKKVVRSCIKCTRFNAKIIQPMMGDLPAARVQPAPPFSTTGADYAGPFILKNKRGRGSKTSKCWICLFVCFITRAIHLELVSSLSTQDFIQALRRFVSRRGTPSDIYSDNGTNFIGAQRELSSFLSDHSSQITDASTNLNIRWHFIPPSSPHFGGIWEAGVKSVKFHLKRIVSNVPLTFEDFNTLLIQIEATLNSRPICPLSSDPQDLNPLTPAHFLVGRPLTTIPEANLQDVPTNRLSHYQHLQLLNQHFWNRWSNEYAVELQRRSKWKQTDGQLQLGQLILVKENNVPPIKWRLGRIIELFPGADNIARVASIKTADGVIRRSFAKICPLPVN